MAKSKMTMVGFGCVCVCCTNLHLIMSVYVPGASLRLLIRALLLVPAQIHTQQVMNVKMALKDL